MNVLVTCGPSYEPIDEVRRITNASTGGLGVMLAARLAADGHEVTCCKGVMSVAADPACRVRRFSTNDDLLAQLEEESRRKPVEAFFHVAALCDFKVGEVTDGSGSDVRSAKISSRSEEVVLRMTPARKVIGELRRLFPAAWIVGWKYEMEGGRASALERGFRQMRENGTAACVVNGRAFGTGFGFCEPPDRCVDLPDQPALADFLSKRLAVAAG